MQIVTKTSFESLLEELKQVQIEQPARYQVQLENVHPTGELPIYQVHVALTMIVRVSDDHHEYLLQYFRCTGEADHTDTEGPGETESEKAAHDICEAYKEAIGSRMKVFEGKIEVY